MGTMVQKFIVEDVEKASSLMPAHIALVNPDGTPYTGPVAAYVDPSTGTAQQIIGALIAAGIMANEAKESSVQTMAAPMNADVEPEADETKPTMDNTAEEIRSYAEAKGIEVPSKATKAEILELIG